MAAASMMRDFEHAPFPEDRFLGGLSPINSRSPTRQIPWSQGKRQGISPIQRFFAKIRLENLCEFRCLRMNSLRRRAGNFLASAGNLHEQGMRREFHAKELPRSPRD